MAIDFGGWSTADNYQTAFVPKMNEALLGLAVMLDPARVSYTGAVPVGAKRISGGSLQQWNGTIWADIPINGVELFGATVKLGYANETITSEGHFLLQRINTSSAGGRINWGRALDASVAYRAQVEGAGTSPSWQLVDGAGTLLLDIQAGRLGVGGVAQSGYRLHVHNDALVSGVLDVGADKHRLATVGATKLELTIGSAHAGAATMRAVNAGGVALLSGQGGQLWFGVNDVELALLSDTRLELRRQLLVQSTSTETGLLRNSTAGSAARLTLESNDRWLRIEQRSSTHPSGEAALLQTSSPVLIVLTGENEAMRWGGGNTTVAGSLLRATSGVLSFGASHASGEVDILAGGAGRVRVAANGRIGVGKTAPDRLLDVAGGAMTSPMSVSYAAALSIDAAASNVFVVGSLTGNVTSLAISNPQAGQFVTLRFRQDGTGGRTVALPAGAKVAGQIETSANRASYLNLTWTAVDNRWEGSWFVVPA